MATSNGGSGSRNGQYTLRMAGINQDNPKNFLTDNGGGTFAQEDFRGGAPHHRQFDINRDWTFGWDGTLQHRPHLHAELQRPQRGQRRDDSFVHLTGLHDRNYFDARVDVFPDPVDLPHDRDQPFSTNNYDQDRQAVVCAGHRPRLYLRRSGPRRRARRSNSNLTNLSATRTIRS